MYTYTYMYMYMYMYMYVYMYVYMYTHIHRVKGLAGNNGPCIYLHIYKHVNLQRSGCRV